MNKKYIIIGGVLVFASVLIYFKGYLPKHTFETVKINKIEEFNSKLTSIGNLESEKEYSITPYSSGNIKELYVKNNDFVKKGQLLFTIDPVDKIIELNSLKVKINQSKLDVQSLEHSLKSLISKKELAQNEFIRMDNLWKRKFISDSEFEKYASDLISIKEDIKSFKKKIDNSKLNIKIMKNNYLALEKIINNLNIKSPTNGYITKLNIEKQQFINSATVAMKIINPKDLWITTRFDERISSKLKLNQKAEVKFRSNEKKIYNGYIYKIEKESDAVTLEKIYEVKLEKIPNNFSINEQAKVTINYETFKNVLSLPIQILTMYKQEEGVWINKDGKTGFFPLNVLAKNDTSFIVRSNDKNNKLLYIDVLKNINNIKMKEGIKIIK